MLVAFRVAQAAGAALMTPTSLGLLLAAFPPERRGGAVRTWTAIGGFAAALGPLVGGVLVASSWRWIFLVNVPIGLVALAIGYWKLPEVPGHDVRRADAWGATLVTFGIGVLTYGIMKTGDWGWMSRGTGSMLALAALLLGLFVIDCLRSENPFIDPALFTIRPFTGATLTMAPYSMAFGAGLLSIALWTQQGWGWSALKAGVAIAPGPFLVPVTSLLLAGRLIARFGVAVVVTLGVTAFMGLVWFPVMPGLEPSMPTAVIGMGFLGLRRCRWRFRDASLAEKRRRCRTDHGAWPPASALSTSTRHTNCGSWHQRFSFRTRTSFQRRRSLPFSRETHDHRGSRWR